MKQLTKIMTGRFALVAYLSLIGLLIVYLILLRVDTHLKNNAINECAKISKFQVENESEGTTINYPLIDIYEDCLKTKGINPQGE